MQHINSVQVELKDPLASLVIPVDLKNNQLFLVQSYVTDIRGVKKDITKFTDDMCVT